MAKPRRIKEKPAKYLPSTISLSFMGRVEIISIVPMPFSLEIRPIDTAGMKKRYTIGIILNSTLMSDSFIKKNCILKKYPFINAKTTKNM